MFLAYFWTAYCTIKNDHLSNVVRLNDLRLTNYEASTTLVMILVVVSQVPACWTNVPCDCTHTTGTWRGRHRLPRRAIFTFDVDRMRGTAPWSAVRSHPQSCFVAFSWRRLCIIWSEVKPQITSPRSGDSQLKAWPFLQDGRVENKNWTFLSSKVNDLRGKRTPAPIRNSDCEDWILPLRGGQISSKRMQKESGWTVTLPNM